MLKSPKDWRGKHVTVFGFGQSGRAAASLLLKLGAEVLVVDRAKPARGDKDVEQLALAGVRFCFSKDGGRVASTEKPVREADAIVMSPGIRADEHVRAAAASGVPVLSEIELAWRMFACPVLAVTGTNGKSTVVSMLAEMLRADGVEVALGGNLGTPLSHFALQPAFVLPSQGARAAVVAEVSSYQLEHVDAFAPKVACWLNLSTDHLERHGSMAAYAATKARIFAMQGANDHAIVPAGDPMLLAFARASAAQVHGFGGYDGEVRVLDGGIVCEDDDVVIPASALPSLRGVNLDNACAAAVMARCFGVQWSAIRGALAVFQGLPHRNQSVGTVAGVHFVDDSKATNIDAALQSVRGVFPDVDSFTSLRGGAGRPDDELRSESSKASLRGVILIAGGMYKGGDKAGDEGGNIAPLVDAMASRGKGVVLIGRDAALFAAAFAGTSLRCAHASSMEEAVRTANAWAMPGDCVLLAPGCASFDMFASFEDRGRRFQASVRELQEAEAELSSETPDDVAGAYVPSDAGNGEDGAHGSLAARGHGPGDGVRRGSAAASDALPRGTASGVWRSNP